jgi:photosystem II P680 reaction center D1 protein
METILFLVLWETSCDDVWLHNDGPYELIVLHFLLGVAYYMEREGELSFCLDMCSWIIVAYLSLVAVAITIFLIYPINQGSVFLDGMSL